MLYDDFQIKSGHQFAERLAMTLYGLSNKELNVVSCKLAQANLTHLVL